MASTWGQWLQKDLEDLSAAPDELDHACREARDFASHFSVSYDICIVIIMEAAKQARVFSMYPRPTVVVLIRQPSQNIDTSREA